MCTSACVCVCLSVCVWARALCCYYEQRAVTMHCAQSPGPYGVPLLCLSDRSQGERLMQSHINTDSQRKELDKCFGSIWKKIDGSIVQGGFGRLLCFHGVHLTQDWACIPTEIGPLFIDPFFLFKCTSYCGCQPLYYPGCRLPCICWIPKCDWKNMGVLRPANLTRVNTDEEQSMGSSDHRVNHTDQIFEYLCSSYLWCQPACRLFPGVPLLCLINQTECRSKVFGRS